MPRAYLLSHGARIGNQPETFVPAGKSISFFSEYDQNTLRANGLAALNNGSIGPNETLTGPCPVPNYYHPRFEDEAIAQHLAAESSASGGKSYYVGSDLPDPSWLCTTPAQCRTTYPQHSPGCQGIFTRVSEDEIYSVACRGLAGGSGGATRSLEGSEDFRDELSEEAQRIVTWSGTDPGAAMQYWESLTDTTRQMLQARDGRLKTWSESYYKGGGASSTAAVLEARRYLEAYGEETFFTWIESLPTTDKKREMIMGDTDLAAAYETGRRMTTERGRQESAQGEWEEQAAGTWVPSSSDLNAVAETNQSTVKAAGDGDELDFEVAGFVMLIGTGHDPSWYEWVRAESDYCTGKLAVTKGGVFSKGGFEVTGCPMTKQGVVQSALEAFSDKEVTFA